MRCSSGRSKEATTSAGSRSPSRAAMSARVGGAAVAVSATTGGSPEPLDHRAQPQVVGPEVVPPLGDAVGLVDDEQRDARGPQRLDDLVVGQLLGGEEHVLGTAVAQLLPRPAGLRRALRGVDHHGVGRLGVGEPLPLVALQGDQRGDDHGRAVEQQGGNLVDRRLACAGGQHREHVAAVGERLHGRQLLGAQLCPAERLLGDAGQFLPRPVPGAATSGRRCGRTFGHGARPTPPARAPTAEVISAGRGPSSSASTASACR